MTDFLRDLSSPYWWLSVAVMTVVLHIVAVYLIRRMDKLGSRTSSWWRSRSEKRIAENAGAVETLLAEKDEEILLSLSELRDRTMMATLWPLGVIVTALGIALGEYSKWAVEVHGVEWIYGFSPLGSKIGGIVGVIFGMLFVFLGGLYASMSRRKLEILYEVRARKRKMAGEALDNVPSKQP